MASVFYKDNYDEYVTSSSDFTDRIDDLQEFISNHNAGGGGDFPEAVDAGLEVALNKLSWSETATTKIIFLILDCIFITLIKFIDLLHQKQHRLYLSMQLNLLKNAPLIFVVIHAYYDMLVILPYICKACLYYWKLMILRIRL
jgi:hypothetical protein